jgi:hypothetical protein
MCVLSTQGLSAISSVLDSQGMRDHLLNNCRTKFFFGNDCPQTSEYFEYIGGVDDRKVRSVQFKRAPAIPRFRLPNHVFVEDSPMTISGCCLENRRQPRFSSADLGQLPNGTALVVMKGRLLVRYTMDPQAYASGLREDPCRA